MLAHVKHNLAPRQPSLTYKLEFLPEHGVCRIAWLGVSALSADDLLQPPDIGEEKTAKQEAVEFLKGFLANGPKLAQECYTEARKLKIGDTVLRKAKPIAGVVTIQGCDGEGHFTGVVWQLKNTGTPAY